MSAERWRRSLLTCGILASVLYVAMTLFVGLLWEGYSVVSGVPSELSAIGAPTRLLWMWLGTVYAVLMLAFGWIVWKSATVFFVLIVGFAAAALSKRFRVYSIATMVTVLACGAVTGTYASRIETDLPTPWVGVWERISIATFMGWIAVLATALLRAQHAAKTP